MPQQVRSKNLQVDEALAAYQNVAIPVSSPGEAYLRCGLTSWEQSVNGSAWAALGGGFSRFIWLAQGSTYAVIQAALNNVNYDGVYLEPGALAYAITGNLTIPDGKFLIGAYGNPDPAGTRAILAVSAGFSILGQKGTFAYCNVVWTAGSAQPAVVGTGGVADHVHVSTSAGLTAVYAFNGIFSRVSNCSCVGMSGVNITGVPPTAGSPWTKIVNFYASGAGAGAYGIYVGAAPAAYVLIDGARISGGAYGIYLWTPEHVRVRNSFITGSTTKAFYARVAYYLDIANLEMLQCVSGLQLDMCAYFTARGITARNITGSGGVVFTSCTNGEVSDVVVDAGQQYSFQVDACYYVNVVNVTVANSTYAGGAAWAIILGGTGITASNLNVYNFMGNAALVGVGLFLVRSSVRNVVVNGSAGQGITASAPVSCEFSGFMAYNTVGYGIYMSAPENCNCSDFTAVGCSNIGINISNGLYCNFSGMVARTCGTVGAAGGIFVTGCTSCNASDFVAMQCQGIGISLFNTPTYGTYTDFYASASSTKGIYIQGPTNATFSGFNARANLTGGIEIVNGVKSSFNGFDATGNTVFGIKITNPADCTFTGMSAIDTILGVGPGHGISDTTSTRCKFSSIKATGNAGHGVSAGAGASNSHWSDIACTNNTMFGFVAGNAAALCSVDGLFTQGNASPFSFGVFWQVALGQEKVTTPVTFAMSPYPALHADEVILVSAAGGAVTVVLPPVASLPGKHFYVKKVDATANAVSVQEAGGTLIDGITPRVIGVQWQTLHIVSDGVAFYLI